MQDFFSKKFEVCSKTIDALNDVILEKGDVVDVLDRTKGSHWLVRKDHAKDEVSEFPDISIMFFFYSGICEFATLMIWKKNMQDNRIKLDFTFVQSAYYAECAGLHIVNLGA